jgi:hypothetical protein
LTAPGLFPIAAAAPRVVLYHSVAFWWHVCNRFVAFCCRFVTFCHRGAATTMGILTPAGGGCGFFRRMFAGSGIHRLRLRVRLRLRARAGDAVSADLLRIRAAAGWAVGRKSCHGAGRPGRLCCHESSPAERRIRNRARELFETTGTGRDGAGPALGLKEKPRPGSGPRRSGTSGGTTTTAGGPGAEIS